MLLFTYNLCASFRPQRHVLLAQCCSAASQQLQGGSARGSAVQVENLTGADFWEK